ncbi:MAG: DeoR family transcriptional regulator [Methanobrevibacter sp.]|nr:DeoR family transcriptional regulator [Methanobrevibacter sp.]
MAKYKTFTTKEELLNEVKRSLQEVIDNRLTYVDYDKQMLYNSSIDDVDMDSVELYLDILENESIRDLFGKRDLDKILEYIGAGKIDKNNVFHFNKAGALFFTKDISKFDLEHEVKMVRFNGNERLEIIDKHFTQSSFLKLIKEFDSFFYQNTKLGGIVTGMKRTPIPEYPIKAVREAFINAIAHRDYTLTGDCITFYIYDDRIEIISPGKLPYPMTIEDLGVHKNPKHRNKNICKIFETTEYMEHVGTGITRMRDEMKKSNLPEPEFEDGFYFRVVLRGPNGRLILPKNATAEDYKKFNLNDRQIDALLKMKNDDAKFTYKSYVELYNISKSTAKRDLRSLEEQKLIRKLMIDKKYYFFV